MKTKKKHTVRNKNRILCLWHTISNTNIENERTYALVAFLFFPSILSRHPTTKMDLGYCHCKTLLLYNRFFFLKKVCNITKKKYSKLSHCQDSHNNRFSSKSSDADLSRVAI